MISSSNGIPAGDRAPDVGSAGLQFESIDGQSVAFRSAGQGPPLVLLHGFLSDSRCWRPQLAGLSADFSVVAWDAPGAGASSDPPDTCTTADYARCLAGLLDALDIERFHLVGLSWGGILAQEVYRLYPGRLRGLVLADTYAGWKGSLPEAVWKERLATCLGDADAPPDTVVGRLLPGMFSESAPAELWDEQAAIMSQFHPPGFRVMTQSSADMDTRDLLPAIDVPTLLLWGEDDQRSPLHIAEQFRAAIPGAELAVIPGAGHVSNMEQPDAFNDHVRRFCLAPTLEP